MNIELSSFKLQINFVMADHHAVGHLHLRRKN